MDEGTIRPQSMEPLVSIIVPNFNHERFLKARIESILAQTFDDFELIILDDASGDNSLEIIRLALANHPCKIDRNEFNSGQPCAQWLKGIRQATGKYIWIAESDDTCSSLFLETMVAQLEQGSVLSYCRTNNIDAHGESIDTASFWPDTFDARLWKNSFSMESKELCKRFMPRGNVIPNASCVVFRRPSDSVLRKLHSVTCSKRYTGDWIFWSHYLMLMQGSVWFESRELSSFRSHESTTRNIGEPGKGYHQSAERRRFAEYSSAISAILRVTHPWPRMQWLWIANRGGWDWIISEYLFRYRPKGPEKIVIVIIKGVLRIGIYVRLIKSNPIRRHYFASIS